MTEKTIEEKKNTEPEMKEIEKPVKKLGFWTLLKRVSSLNFKLSILIGHAFSIIIQLIQTIFPFIYGKIVDSITKNNDLEGLNYYVMLYITLIIGNTFLNKISSFLNKKKSSTDENLKLMFYESILDKDYEFFDFYKTGELLSRYNQDYYQIYNFTIDNMFYMIMQPVKVIIYLVSLFQMSWELTLFNLFVMLFDLKHIFTFHGKNNKRKHNWKLHDDAFSTVNEALTNIRVIKSFSTEKKEHERVRVKLDKYYEQARELNEGMDYFREIGDVFKTALEVIQLWYAGKKIIEGTFSMGQFTSFQLIAKQVSQIMPNLPNQFQRISQSVLCCERLFELVDYEAKIKNNDKNIQKEFKGEIEFKNVLFSYPLKPDVGVLKELNLKINKGEVIAIVGESGSGKSTIAALMQRFYDVDRGEITIDGVNIKDYNLEWLHKNIGYVSQEPSLFGETIEFNIAYALDTYTVEDLDKAAKLANAYNFIHDKEQFPDGYKTMLGSKGLNLSGGQKQRIAIARALIKKVKILVFDEATSALDANSEHEVQKAIDEIVKIGNITTIIIAHRLSTVKNCNRILVMEKGKIVESGKHADLLLSNGYYKQLIDKQLENNIN